MLGKEAKTFRVVTDVTGELTPSETLHVIAWTPMSAARGVPDIVALAGDTEGVVVKVSEDGFPLAVIASWSDASGSVAVASMVVK